MLRAIMHWKLARSFRQAALKNSERTRFLMFKFTISNNQINTTCIHACRNLHTHVCVCKYTYTCICMCAYTCVQICSCVHTHMISFLIGENQTIMDMRVHTYIYVYTYRYVQIDTLMLCTHILLVFGLKNTSAKWKRSVVDVRRSELLLQSSMSASVYCEKLVCVHTHVCIYIHIHINMCIHTYTC